LLYPRGINKEIKQKINNFSSLLMAYRGRIYIKKTNKISILLFQLELKSRISFIIILF